MDQVAERLAELRERRALTLRELGEMSGVAGDTINQIELGHRKARPSTLRKLARALEIDVQEFYAEPALGKGSAPREAGQPETSAQTVEEFERALASVLEPVRTEARREQQAANRTLSSGVPQRRIVDPAEAETGNRFLDEFSPDERPLAFSEIAMGYARFERDNTNLREALRERDQKIARLEQEVARLGQLEQENTRLREEAAKLREQAVSIE